MTVRKLHPDEWRLYRSLRLRALRDSPDAFGSTYARESAFPDAEWIERLARGTASSGDLPLVAECDGEPCALLWARVDESAPSKAHLYQMWVAPECRRRRVGHALLETVAAWARTVGVDTLELDVTLENEPAVRLYERAGFTLFGESRPLRPGSELRAQAMRRVIGPLARATERTETPP